MAADAAEHCASRPLHVNLAVDVDLDGGVHGDERAGGQPAEVVRVLNGVQDGASVRPFVELRPACQVGGYRLADQQAARCQVYHGPGEQAGVDPDRDRELAQQCVANRTGSHLQPHALGDERGDPAGDLLVLGLARSIPEHAGRLRRLPHDGDLIRVKRRTRVGARHPPRDDDGHVSAGADSRPLPGDLAAERVPCGAPSGDDAGYEQVRPPRPVQQRRHGGQPDGREPDQAGRDAFAQSPAGHDRPDISKRREVEPWVGPRHPAEDQPHSPGSRRRTGKLRRHRAGRPEAVAERDRHPRPHQVRELLADGQAVHAASFAYRPRVRVQAIRSPSIQLKELSQYAKSKIIADGRAGWRKPPTWPGSP
ncbi:MAG TPA: hypothetical protein VI365_18520 [Trebonia sp.]